MPIDFLAEHWNDVLTIGTFAVALVTGIYQVKDVLSKRAGINIIEIKDASYIPQEKQMLSDSPHTIPDFDDIVHTRPAEIETDELDNTYYTLSLLLENDGREPATISKAELVLSDTQEVLELFNDHDNPRRLGAHLELDGKERNRVNFSTRGNVREDYTGSVRATLRLDTTAGIVTESVELFRPYE